jgi:hypothetical protein
MLGVPDAQALEAEGKTGLIILPGVKRVLAEIRGSPKAEQHHAICTSGTATSVPDMSVIS